MVYMNVVDDINNIKQQFCTYTHEDTHTHLHVHTIRMHEWKKEREKIICENDSIVCVCWAIKRELSKNCT